VILASALQFKMKKNIAIYIILGLLMLIITSPSYSDELWIPISCWPKDLQQAFHEEGMKLDLNNENRTDESWGYLVNKGSEFVLYTYYPATQEDFRIIQKIVFGIDRKRKEKNEQISRK